MRTRLPSSGKKVPRLLRRGAGTLDRLASFYVTYVAIFVFLLLYVFSVKGAEWWLARHFEHAVAAAVRVDASHPDALSQLEERVDALVHRSWWVRLGGVRVTAIVVAADGQTLLYMGGGTGPSFARPAGPLTREQAARWFPPTADVLVSVPHNSLVANAFLVAYAALLLALLFRYDRRLAEREQRRLERVLSEREAAAERAERIERELARVRERLARGSGAEAEEIRALRAERERLHAELAELARREEELAARAGRAQELEQEHAALEELLEEAVADLERKEEEIRQLERRLRRAARPAAAAAREREAETLGRRLRTLYRNLEIDERALRDLAGLGDARLKLRAEEALKRLSDSTETAAIRRKVGGLPGHLAIYELGFAGRGRIYYARGRQRRYRVLAIGTKSTQKRDLEYLSRLPRED